MRDRPGFGRVTPAEIIELARAAAHGRRGPPSDYGRFPAALSDDELAGFFVDETDRRLIARRRREPNRLGFALQLGTVRYLGPVSGGSLRGAATGGAVCRREARDRRSRGALKLRGW